MKKLMAIAITLMMALGSYAPSQARTSNPDSGSVIVVVDGRTVLALNTQSCVEVFNLDPSQAYKLEVFDDQENLLQTFSFTKSHLILSETDFAANADRLKLVVGRCYDETNDFLLSN